MTLHSLAREIREVGDLGCITKAHRTFVLGTAGCLPGGHKHVVVIGSLFHIN